MDRVRLRQGRLQVIEEGAKKPSKRVVQRFGEAGADRVRVALDGNGGCRPQVLPVTAGVIEEGGRLGLFFISGFYGNLLQDIGGDGRGLGAVTGRSDRVDVPY